MARPKSIAARLALALIVLGVVGAGVVLLMPGSRPGSGTGSGSIARRIVGAIAGDDERIAVPDWIADRILRLVNDRLRPQLRFAELSYEPPLTITLTDASLITPESERIVEVETLVITLAERPKEGEPLRFAGVSLRSGTVRLIVLDKGEHAGGLAGFSRMMRDDPRTKQTPESQGRAFSDTIELRDVVIRDFAFEYAGPGLAVPLRLDHIDATMDLATDANGTGSQTRTRTGTPDTADNTNTGSNPDELKGWYTIGFSSGRSPGFELGFDGRLNLDTLDAEIRDLTASIDAGPQTISTLPDRLARVLRSSDIRGRINATGSASANLRSPGDAHARVTLQGSDLNAGFGDYRVPVETLRIVTTLNDGILGLAPFEADIHGGRVTVTGTSRLTETGMPFDASWSIETLELSDLLRQRPSIDSAKADGDPSRPTPPPRLAGKLTAEGTVRSELSNPRGTLSGSGTANLTEGRLLVLPGLSKLASLVSGKDDSADTAMNHRGTAEFVLDPSGARITDSEIVTNLIAARGTGTVSFDRTLDLRVNAGPLEKIQSLLGPLGDLFGAVTDRLLKYTIKGTFDAPEVGVAPLGID